MASRRRPPRASPDELLTRGADALGLRLGPDQIAAFRLYREELARWSARLNLTALRTAEEVVRAGFLDSLACLPLVPPGALRVVDVGSGAGFPALPLKLLRPDLSLTLVEASRKKATFLQHMARRLGLAGIRVIQARAEVVARDPREAGAYDLGLARAVASPPVAGGLVRPLLRPGGLFLVQLGADPLLPGDRDRLLAQGFEAVRELPLPPALGRPGRRVLALRRAATQCFT
jgi:16S rRNA (guanine527-N7)-methyltransferase